VSLAAQVLICLASNTAPPGSYYLTLQLSIKNTKVQQKRGSVRRERTRLRVVQGCVQHNAFTRDFTPSFPCEVLQEGD